MMRIIFMIELYMYNLLINIELHKKIVKNLYTYIIINATPATQIKKLRKYRTRRGKKNETIDITKHRLLAIPTSSIFHQNDERTSQN